MGFGGCRSRRKRFAPTLLCLWVWMRRGGRMAFGYQNQRRGLHCVFLLPSPPSSPVWTSSLSPSLHLAAYPRCLLVCTLSPALTFLLPFSPLPPFCSFVFVCCCLFLPLLYAQFLRQPFPAAVPSEVPGPTHLGVVPTSVTPASRAIFTPG